MEGHPVIFQSTRPVKGATAKESNGTGWGYISIHAPGEGRDAHDIMDPLPEWIFQSTRPVKGATEQLRGSRMKKKVFQSTRPVKGATAHTPPTTTGQGYFNPRAR